MKDRGINYLALKDLFQLSNRRKDIINYDIHVQMVEIYNEQTFLQKIHQPPNILSYWLSNFTNEP